MRYAPAMMDDLHSPPDEPVRVLHDDQHLFLVDQPSGLLSVPGRGEHLADCMMPGRRSCFPRRCSSTGWTATTSGLMVFALTKHAQRHLSLQFEERRVRKVYQARLWGALEPKTGTVDLPLIVD